MRERSENVRVSCSASCGACDVPGVCAGAERSIREWPARSAPEGEATRHRGLRLGAEHRRVSAVRRGPERAGIPRGGCSPPLTVCEVALWLFARLCELRPWAMALSGSFLAVAAITRSGSTLPYVEACDVPFLRMLWMQGTNLILAFFDSPLAPPWPLRLRNGLSRRPESSGPSTGIRGASLPSKSWRRKVSSRAK